MRFSTYSSVENKAKTYNIPFFFEKIKKIKQNWDDISNFIEAEKEYVLTFSQKRQSEKVYRQKSRPPPSGGSPRLKAVGYALVYGYVKRRYYFFSFLMKLKMFS